MTDGKTVPVTDENSSFIVFLYCNELKLIKSTLLPWSRKGAMLITTIQFIFTAVKLVYKLIWDFSFFTLHNIFAFFVMGNPIFVSPVCVCSVICYICNWLTSRSQLNTRWVTGTTNLRKHKNYPSLANFTCIVLTGSCWVISSPFVEYYTHVCWKSVLFLTFW